MTGGAPRRRALAYAAAGIAALVAASGCARLLTRPARVATHDATAIIAAGAARERALAGLRLTLSVRATAGPPAARLAAPAYLAIDDADHLRLQVLSPFGPTVLDLATDADAFTLRLPMRGETRRGAIDVAALAAGTTPEDERMIVALALLFRPKMDRRRCRAAGPAAVNCALAADLTVTTTVDAALRPTREDFLGPGGRPLFTAVFEDYGGAAGSALPGRITISGDGGDGALVIRVVKARRPGESAA
ncbi:MAG: hypothetical protein IT294_03740 [Deltaproteobacteria bacterium]|nr:hypothetical protein [Deltaproteobacteria bacterium]